MRTIVDKLMDSTPSKLIDNASMLFSDMMEASVKYKWVLYSSAVLGLDYTSKLAENFISSYATVGGDNNAALSPVPVDIFKATVPFQFIVLLYSNGAVALATSDNSNESELLFCWVHSSIIDAMELPYIDADKGLIKNMDAKTYLETSEQLDG